MSQPRPLDGIRVIEVGQLLAGPFAGTMLAYFGAEVIKVEPPGTGDPIRNWRLLDESGTGYWWRSLGRNKKSVTVNLRGSEGRKILSKLIDTADVLIENFKPGTMEALIKEDVEPAVGEGMRAVMKGFDSLRKILKPVIDQATEALAPVVDSGLVPKPRDHSRRRSTFAHHADDAAFVRGQPAGVLRRLDAPRWGDGAPVHAAELRALEALDGVVYAAWTRDAKHAGPGRNATLRSCDATTV